MGAIVKILTAFLTSLFLVRAAAAAQEDLLQRAREKTKEEAERLKKEASAQVRYTRDRVTLSLRPGLTLREDGSADKKKKAEVKFGVDVGSNFACGQFDIRANLYHTFSKELREQAVDQLLDVAKGELVSNGLSLFCQSAPSLCDAFKFYHLAAQGRLALDYDKCARIEESIDSAIRKGRAAAIQSCLARKQKEGVPLEQAMRECEAENRVTNLLGQPVKTIDLVNEIKELFGLDPEVARDVQVALGDRSMSGGGRLDGRVDPAAGERRFTEIQERYRERWDEAIRLVEAGHPVGQERLKALVPFEDLGLVPAELNTIASLPARIRELVLQSITTQAAFAELVRRYHRIERLLEAALQMPGAESNPTYVREYTRAREQLRREIERLAGEYREKVATQERLAEIIEAAYADRRAAAGRVLQRFAGARLDESNLRSLPQYGKDSFLGRYTVSSDGRIQREGGGGAGAGEGRGVRIKTEGCCGVQSGWGAR